MDNFLIGPASVSRRSLALTASVLMFAIVAAVFPISALATNNENEEHKVDICHNGNVINVDEDGWNGHSNHDDDFLVDEDHPCVGEDDDEEENENLTCSLVADPSTITEGGSTTLTLNIEGEDADEASATVDNGVGSLGDGDTSEVSPTDTTTYTATISGGEEDEDPITCETTVTVNPEEENPPTPSSCVIYSDTTTLEDGSASFAVSPIHLGWTASIPTAIWIWGENPIADAVNTMSETFTKSFLVTGAPTGATLMIAADNSYTVSINGNPVGADAGEFNYSAGGQDSYSIPAGDLNAGTNTIEFTVTNFAQSGGTMATNPAGLLYKLTVDGTDCGELPPPPPTDVCDNIPEDQPSVPEGYEENDGICTPVIQNSCAAPSNSEEVIELGSSNEMTLQQVLDFYSYGVDADDDQVNTQTWDGSGNTIHFSAKLLKKLSGYHHVFGYYTDGSLSNFVPLFDDAATTTPGGTFNIDVADVNAPGVGFAIKAYNGETLVGTWATDQGESSDENNHAVVYNPSDNTYVIGFDDQTGIINDQDFNDIVVEVKVTGCEDPDQITVIATKIVCEDESDLPNAMGSSHVTDADTAADFLDTHPSCHLESGWQFEWGNQTSNDPGKAFVGHATGYTPSGLTGEDGTVTMNIPLEGNTEIRLRELLQEGYIPFTYGPDHQSNSNTVSAEFSCSNDGLNYDNWDYIRNPQVGSTYYCVAWNVPTEDNNEEPTTGTIVIVKNSEGGNGLFHFVSETISEVSEGGFDLLTENGTATRTFSSLTPGSYDVGEVVPEGWDLSSASCSDESDPESIGLSAGETVTCTFTNTKESNDTPNTPGFTNGSGGKKKGSSTGSVLGAATQCGPLLSTFMGLGRQNDTTEVKELQQFLNDHMGSGLPITGFFGPLTDAAVRAFQLKYMDDVLAPWVGLPNSGIPAKTHPTGYVYKTTQRMINNIYCSTLNLPLPPLD
ncbi:MAG: hypothetical protein ABA06_02020 [Parcubacteria bacterium C7867-001]|nr:MAG: hypothetical protein ABA06_02020 [Parcubacteria bacterium C7867-001]